MLHRSGTSQATPGCVYQALAPLPEFEGNHAVIGAWVIASQPAGIGIREDDGPRDHQSQPLRAALFRLMDSGIVFASPANYLTTLPSFAAFFAAAIVLLAIFVALYMFVTPHRELRLIQEGNVAAAVSLSGAIIGFVIPLASAIQSSVNLLDAAMWGFVALLVQILTFLLVRLLMPRVVHHIETGELAPAVTLATISVAVGVLNAACVTY